MVFSITSIVEIRTREIRANHQGNSVGNTELTRETPKIIDRIGNVIVKRLVLKIVIAMGVETMTNQVTRGTYPSFKG